MIRYNLACGNRNFFYGMQTAGRTFSTDFAAYDTNGKVENALENEDFGEFYAPIGAVNIEYETAYFCHCLANGIKPQICPVEQSLAAVIINEKEYACVKQQ